MTTDNPLLKESTYPHGAPLLDQVKVEHFMPALKTAIAAAKAEIAGIKNNPEKPDYANTIEALEFSGVALGRVLSVFGELSGTMSSPELRAIEDDIYQASIQHSSDVVLDADLFKRVKAVYDQKDQLNLTGEQKMLLTESYKGFVRSGALLDDAGKKRLRELKEELSTLGTKYKNNSLQSIDAYQKVIDDENALRGVPERAKNDYRAAAEEAGMKGKFLIKLSPPPMDIAYYCENRALREEIARAQSNVSYKGAFDNSQIVMDIVKRRHELAQLMGYNVYADYVLDNRMAKTTTAVMDFLRKNEKAYRPAAEEYLQKVRDYAQKTDGLTDLKPWDMAFYGRKLKEETFQLNLEDLRPYFDLERVLEGLRHHAEKLFDIDMKETKGVYPVNHPDIKVYEVSERKTGEVIGVFYGDFYARPGQKRSGAWMNSYRDRGIEDGENKIPLVVNVCNFAKPTKEQPTLLSLDDVRTVFHEFGHALHALLARGNYASLSGTNVKWDFVELPSQLQENWVQRKEVLDTFARHHKTGDLLPPDLIRKMNDMENFDAGYFGLRQTFLGLLDMAWHAVDPATIKDVETLEDKLCDESWLFPRMAGPMSTNFGHIFAGGYAAGYYSYKWAEVLDADIFESFLEKGLYDPETAHLVKTTIYQQGGTRDPMDIYMDAKKRAPDPDALFRREGLLPKPGNDDNGPHNKKAGPSPK